MIIKIEEIVRLLQIINIYSSSGKSSTSFVKKTFNDKPIREAILPSYSEIEKLCQDLGIIEINSNSVNITELGNKILESTDESITINNNLKNILLECFLSGEIGKTILESISKFNIAKNGSRWYPKQSVYDLFARPEMLPVLYEIGLLEKKHNIVELNNNLIPTAIERIQKLQLRKEIRITQKQIDASLQTKKIIGNIAEKIALEYEKNRLKQGGFDKESEKVVLISQEFANAGYDICSFNGKSDDLEFDRFIEVKGSTGSDIDFFWSQNEIEEAKKRGDRYWLYFIPSIDIKKQNDDNPILIQNPIKGILENDHYDTQIESLHVMRTNDFTNNQ